MSLTKTAIPAVSIFILGCNMPPYNPPPAPAAPKSHAPKNLQELRFTSFNPVGPEPTAEEGKQTSEKFRAVILTYLKDPDSAKIREDGVKREGGEWVYWFSINAKNSYGGYTGYKNYGVILRNGKEVGTVGLSNLVDTEGLLGITVDWTDEGKSRYDIKQ